MIKNSKFLQDFEDEQTEKDDMTLEEKLSLLNSLYKYALKLGTLPPDNPLEGIEDDIKLARIINGVWQTIN